MALCLLVAGAAVAQAARRTLVMDGRVVSADVRVIAGRPYVPLADVARATGRALAVKGSRYELITAGGANQVARVRGKVGDTLFDGKWRFRVAEVQQASTYTLRREGGIDPGKAGGNVRSDGKTFSANPGYTLVIVNCHVKNGQKATEAFGSAYGEHTALADTEGSSYRPVGWDQEGGMFTTKPLLPGAGQDLTAIFLVPEGKKLKDLVVTLTNTSDRNPNDVRISLAQD